MRWLRIKVRRALFGIAAAEGTFERRSFAPTSADRRARLEAIAGTFIKGYNAALADTADDLLAETPDELRGFAVEGEAMACAILDRMTPWNRARVARLLAKRPEHLYMIHVGVGWAVARLRGSLRRHTREQDPLLSSLVADGWGFHQAFFAPERWARGRARHPLGGHMSRAVDQGIGRALWFVCGADAERIADHVAQFEPDRRSDLWSGIGLAATYAGGVDTSVLEALIRHAADQRAHLAQGSAFAATARAVAKNSAPHVELASSVLTGRSVRELADIALTHEPRAAARTLAGAYERWRRRIRETLQRSEAA
jgi:enediyne biosynthesis protein E3